MTVENEIKNFTNNFFNFLKNKEPTYIEKKAKGNVIRELDLGYGYHIKFLKKWVGTDKKKNVSEKKYYLVLFKDNICKLELFLCRILFDEEKITWYLDTPKNEISLKIYNKLFGNRIEINKIIVEKIQTQQQKIHSNKKFLKVNNGYLIGEKENSETNVFNKLNTLLLMIRNEMSSDDEAQERFAEGIAYDTKVRKYTRNRGYIEACKKRDNYTCQGCGLKLNHQGKDVLQVHHKNPLTSYRKTKPEDLITLCPSCHFIAHLNRPIPYNVEEIRKIRNTAPKTDPYIEEIKKTN